YLALVLLQRICETLWMRTTNERANRNGNTSLGWEDKAWDDQELDGAYFQDWANTKAAYRFFSNPRVSEEENLSGHFASTQVRAAAIKEPLLVLHDTTEF